MINFQNLSFDYDGRKIFQDVNLEAPAGSFLFLTGPSGAGKSTFLKLCYLALSPSQGDGHIFGLHMGDFNAKTRAELRRRIGLVHQDCQFIEHISIAENILLPLKVTGRLGSHSDEDLSELLKWVGLSHRRDAYPKELSGGERQRAALARAIITDPEMIIADEPTGNIDWEMAKRVIYLLIQLNKMGKTILVATHDLNMVRVTKRQIKARVLRISNQDIRTAGST